MRNSTILFCLVVTLLSCSRESASRELYGYYTGTFSRSGSPDPVTSVVSVHFNGSEFSGTSSSARYPVLCKGTFTLENTHLSVSNNCFFTADFDWTLVFNGEYEASVDGPDLVIWRTYPNGSRDYYQLRKTQ